MFSIAYRMLATVSEAEDVVQDSFLRYVRAQAEGVEIDSPKAYLSTVVTRLAIDELRSAAHAARRTSAQWLPEPLLTDAGAGDPAAHAAEADSLSMAFLLLLERLSPVERAVFLLHDVFGYGYDEVAAIVDKSEANCRQLAHRARRHVQSDKPRFDAPRKRRDELAARFFAAVNDGDVDGLVETLAGRRRRLRRRRRKAPQWAAPIVGVERVAPLLTGIGGQLGKYGITMTPHLGERSARCALPRLGRTADQRLVTRHRRRGRADRALGHQPRQASAPRPRGRRPRTAALAALTFLRRFRKSTATHSDECLIAAPTRRAQGSFRPQERRRDVFARRNGRGMAGRAQSRRRVFAARAIPAARVGDASGDRERRASGWHEAPVAARASPPPLDRAHHGRRRVQRLARGVAHRHETGRGHVGRPSSVVRRKWIGIYSDGQPARGEETRSTGGGGMRIKTLVLVLPMATLFLALSGLASAASFTVLHSFSGAEGETPAAPLVQGSDGFLYGVAAHGGDFTVLAPDGGGTAFRVDSSGTLTTLHVFRGLEGAVPNSLIQGRNGLFLRHDDVRRRDGDLFTLAGLRDGLPDGRGRRGDGAARLSRERCRRFPGPSSRAPTVLSTERSRAESAALAIFRATCTGSIRPRVTSATCTTS